MPTRPRGAPFTPSFALGHAPIGEEGAAMSDVTPLPAGGPRTHEGKQVVRWNATRHGISSPAPVVPGLERTEDLEKHEEGVLESLRPEGHLETVLAERIALLFWRLHRVTRYETGAIAVAQETIEEDIHQREHFMASVGARGSPQLTRLMSASRPNTASKPTTPSGASLLSNLARP
jgi:hypothetical protein